MDGLGPRPLLPPPGTYDGVLQTFLSEAYTGWTDGVTRLCEHGAFASMSRDGCPGNRVTHPCASVDSACLVAAW